MKKVIILFPVIAAIALLTIYGCKKETNTSLQTTDQNGIGGWEMTERSDGSTVLGLQRTIPYKVDIVKQAYNNLYEPDIATLDANYLYVRFLPQNPQDVKSLLDSGLEFWDIPLDYDVVTWGDSYHDPSLTGSEYTYRYAIVKVGTVLPDVQHQILEQLALVPEDCAIAKEGFRLTDNEYISPDEFEANPILVNGTFDYEIKREETADDGGGNGGDCGCPLPNHARKPSGCVQVFDNKLNIWEGVINVEVHTSSTQIFGAIFHRETETDANGCWKINKKYYGKVHVWVKWENGTCDVKTMENDIDLWGYSFPRKAYIGQFGGPNFNNIPIKFAYTSAINSWNFRNWAASTVNNSVFEFGGFLSAEGITRGLSGNLKILITPWGSGNTGAAPMLDKLGPVQQFIVFGGAFGILRGVLNVAIPSAVTTALPLATWLAVAAPDICINLNTQAQVNADDIRELAYHELAHALHYSQAGNNYWLGNIVYTVTHLGYGDGTAPGAGRCSVIESWGFQIGMHVTHIRYGANNSNSGNTTTNTWQAILERDLAQVLSSGTPHIPYAWLWDLQDNNNINPPNEIENGAVTDRVSGITNAQIFSTMTSGMLSMPQMKTAIAPFLPASTPTSTYNTLCAPYGF